MFDEGFKDKPDIKLGNPEIVETGLPDIDLPEQFEILAVIGQGGMGTVYKCRNKYTDRLVAIKVMHGIFNHVSEMRFKQEARAACALTHENAVTVYDFGMTPSGMPYLVMECLDGQSLASMIEEQSVLPEKLVAEIFVGVCSALEAAHKLGIIHRDIKPSNLVITTNLDQTITVKVLDFGIAKILGDEKNQGVTKTGEVFGSPLYMSPEQCAGNNTDLRSDIYSVGASMYESLLGTPPHVGTNAMQTIFKRATEDAPSFFQIRPDLRISSALEDIVMKAIARKPESRYGNVSALKNELAQFLSAPSSSRTRDEVSPAVKSESAKRSSGSQSPAIRSESKLAKSPRHSLLMFVLLAVACTAAAVGAFYLYSTNSTESETVVVKSDSKRSAVEPAVYPRDAGLENLKVAGVLAINDGNYTEAIAKFKEALEYADKNNITDAGTLLFIHDKLAFAYFSRSAVLEERVELNKSIALAKDIDQVADLNCRLGHNFLFSNGVQESVPILEHAVQLARDEKAPLRAAFILNELTYAYYLSKKYKECVNACTEELADLHSVKEKSILYEGTAYARRGESLLLLHDYQRAIDDSKEAVKIMATLDPKLRVPIVDSARKTMAKAALALSTHQNK